MELSDEVLLLVLSFVGTSDLLKVASVCSRWLRITGDELLWRNRLFSRGWKPKSGVNLHQIHTTASQQGLLQDLPLELEEMEGKSRYKTDKIDRPNHFQNRSKLRF